MQGKSKLNVFVFSFLARAISEDCQYDHYKHGEKHDDDRDLQQGKQECDETDELFQQRHNEKDHCNQAAESTSDF